MPFPGTTEGDHTNCACPHCGRDNHYVTQGTVIPHGRFVIFEKACTHCRQKIYYQAQWEIKVTASINHPING